MQDIFMQVSHGYCRAEGILPSPAIKGFPCRSTSHLMLAPATAVVFSILVVTILASGSTKLSLVRPCSCSSSARDRRCRCRRRHGRRRCRRHCDGSHNKQRGAGSSSQDDSTRRRVGSHQQHQVKAASCSSCSSSRISNRSWIAGGLWQQ